MRARSLKPSLFENEVLGSADPLLTILFQGLWCMADREGRLEDRPLRICATIFRYRRRITEKRIDTMLWWLDARSLIARYIVANSHYIQILTFPKHQRPHVNEQASIIPGLSSPEALLRRNPELSKGDLECTPRRQALRSDSGLLTPSSLTPDSLLTGPGDQGDEVGKGSRPEIARQTFLTVQALYPSGLHRGDHWMLAEREIGLRLEEGVTPETLVSAARDYAAQQQALGKLGTNEVMRPSRFYNGSGAWKGPFPLPATASARSTSAADRITYVPTE